MSTNFYWHLGSNDLDDLPHSDDPKVHIGKRSAAGLYCWDCGLTLCTQGEAGVHKGFGFYDTCPRCGTAPTTQEGLNKGAVAVELGFARPLAVRPTGVCSCASFTWAQHPHDVRQRAAQGANVEDEYGRVIDAQEFLQMIDASCPIYLYAIGRWFC